MMSQLCIIIENNIIINNNKYMYNKSKKNEIYTKKAFSSLLTSISSEQTISYYQFLMVVKQLRFKFISIQTLTKIKEYFQNENNKVKKDLILNAIKIVGYQFDNRFKNQIVQLNQQFLSKQIYKQIGIKQVKIIIKKIKMLKIILQQLYGKDKRKWFKVFDLNKKGFITQNQMKLILKNYISSFENDPYLTDLYNIFSKSSGIHIDNFLQIFDQNTLKIKLQNFYHPKQLITKEKPETTIKQPTLNKDWMINHLPPKKSFDFISRKTNYNLRYYRSPNKSGATVQNQNLNKTFSGTNSLKHSIQSFVKKQQYIQPIKFKISKKVKKFKTQNSNPLINQQKIYPIIFGQKNTKAYELRKQFIDQFIISRQRKLQNRRFSNFQNKVEQILGRSFFKMHHDTHLIKQFD